jgi:hypothetical protein
MNLFDAEPAIEFLLTRPVGSKELLLYEREIRLTQFQTWIYFPHSAMDMVRLAGSLAAAKCLCRRERKLLESFKERSNASVEVKRLLRDPIYRALFDIAVEDLGTWTDLVLYVYGVDFQHLLHDRIKDAETVCRMIDYRFRYLDHGGQDRRQADISHSEYYCWKTKPVVSWKTIRQRWSKNRMSAVFLYVNEKLGLRLSPNFDGVGFFSREISMDATALYHMRRFFGTCAYVSEKLRDDEAIDGSRKIVRIPKNVARVRPQTDPLPPSVLEMMQQSYPSEVKKMRRDVAERDILSSAMQ